VPLPHSLAPFLVVISEVRPLGSRAITFWAAWVYAVAQGLALGVMLLTRTVHPPAGTNPILMIYIHAGWSALILPVFIGVAALALCAVLWSRLFPGLVRYPVSWFECSPSRTLWGGWDEDPVATETARSLSGSARAV